MEGISERGGERVNLVESSLRSVGLRTMPKLCPFLL